MYGIYDYIIEAAKRAIDDFDETGELLEYPEVQADKAYYLSILSKFNRQKFLKDKLSELISAIEEEKSVSALLNGTYSDEERKLIYEEISSLKAVAARASTELSDALGCKRANERIYCRLKLKERSTKFGTALFALIKSDLLANEAKIIDENTVTVKGGVVQEISFIAEGAGVFARLSPLTGAHRVRIVQSDYEELCFAVTTAPTLFKLSESDLKIDYFHSGGAGGQNINKVETAVRITHLPSGISVVCQDERSQLKNKKRALDTIEKRLKEQNSQSEKKRVEADISAQYSRKSTAITFDAVANTMTDTRLNSFSKIPFPLSEEQFTQYINGLMAL